MKRDVFRPGHEMRLMIPKTWRNDASACAAALGGVCLALFAGCEPSNTVKAGAPEIVSFGAVSPADGSPVELAGAPPMTNFLAIFDRLLDAASLEDAKGNAKAGLAQIQSMVPTQLVPVTTNYVPNGDSMFFLKLPPGPSLTVLPVCGLPAAGSVVVSLDLTKLRSHDLATSAVPGTLDGGAPVMTTLTVTTAALSVTTDVPPPTEADPVMGTPAALGAADPTTVFNLTFNNVMPGPAAPVACAVLPSAGTHVHVTAEVGGAAAAPIDAVIAPDMMNPSHWTVSPPADTGEWPAGAVVTVTIDKDVTDTYGVALGTATNASFMVKS
ncbi:MAG TPA: hypothetical protein VIU64_07350 [Polyangia bacterium]